MRVTVLQFKKLEKDKGVTVMMLIKDKGVTVIDVD